MSSSTSRAPRLCVALALAGAVGGCATVGPNFRAPEAPPETAFAMAGDEVPAELRLDPAIRVAGPWWRTMGSARLDAVMAEALAGNQTAAAADATLARARAREQSVAGGLKPRLDATAGAQRERINTAAFGFPNFNNPTINLLSVGGSASYDLDIFGGGRRRLEAAAADTRAQARRADAAYLTLTGQVALQAVAIAGLRAEIATVRAIAADDQRNIDIVQAAQNAGGEAPSAGVSVRAQLAEDQAVLPPLAQQLSQARHALAVLVGRSPAEWTAPDFEFAEFSTFPTVPAAVPSELVRHRPDILAAEADLHAATARVGVASANLYPDIRLVAGLTQTALTPGSIFSYGATGWNFGTGLTAPILNGGALRADRRAAEAQARASLALYRQTVLQAFVQVADVLTALAHDDDRIAALSDARSSAQAGLADARTAYRLGGGAALQLVQAQRQLDRALLNLTQARGQRLGDIVGLYAATAADWGAAPRAAAGP
ncbi:MAG: efflux transporter outer membrane subunit [Caulobacteraceae bacterium]